MTRTLMFAALMLLTFTACPGEEEDKGDTDTTEETGDDTRDETDIEELTDTEEPDDTGTPCELLADDVYAGCIEDRGSETDCREEAREAYEDCVEDTGVSGRDTGRP